MANLVVIAKAGDERPVFNPRAASRASTREDDSLKEVKERDIESMLADTRSALTSAGIEALYILCPHSMSGLEALYWEQTYPEEVLAIIGLDGSTTILW